MRSLAVLVLALPFLLAGCGGLLYRSPTVEIADVRVVGLGLTSGTAAVDLQVENPNFFRLEVHELEYLLEIEDVGDRWSRLAEGRSDEKIRLGRRSTETVTLEIPFSYGAMGLALRSWWETGSVGYRLQGDLLGKGPTGEVRVPFRSSGKMMD
ncbi:MAG: LEA type 2 family protein [Gemmatimonadota bacterium]